MQTKYDLILKITELEFWLQNNSNHPDWLLLYDQLETAELEFWLQNNPNHPDWLILYDQLTAEKQLEACRAEVRIFERDTFDIRDLNIYEV
jgi:hypothetical protein